MAADLTALTALGSVQLWWLHARPATRRGPLILGLVGAAVVLALL